MSWWFETANPVFAGNTEFASVLDWKELTPKSQAGLRIPLCLLIPRCGGFLRGWGIILTLCVWHWVISFTSVFQLFGWTHCDELSVFPGKSGFIMLAPLGDHECLLLRPYPEGQGSS